jgi:hypothetical protein
VAEPAFVGAEVKPIEYGILVPKRGKDWYSPRTLLARLETMNMVLSTAHAPRPQRDCLLFDADV